MKSITFTITLFFIIGSSFAQNLVSYCSFEQHTSCPVTSAQANYLIGWNQHTSGTVDYFHACGNPTASVPTNFLGTQAAVHGNAYIGIVNFYGFNINYKEYIHTNIPALTVGKTYEVSMSVSLADDCVYASDGLGVHFYLNGSSPITTTGVLPVTPKADFSNKTITNKTGWDRLVTIFIADSAYTNIVIGGFLDSVMISTTPVAGGNNYISYYYVDSVVIRPIISILTHLKDSVFCPGEQISVPYTAVNPNIYDTNNTFTLQLSGPTGSFATPLNLNTISSMSSDTITGILPASLAPGTGYRVRIFSTSPTDTSKADSITIDVKPRPIPVAISNSPICEGSTLTLSSSALSGSSFSWTGPSAYNSSQQNNSIPNTTPSYSGDYIITATLNGCSAKDTVTVLVKPMPSVPVAGNNGPTCTGGTLNLNSSSAPTGVTYTWTGPVGFTSAVQNPSISNSIISNSGLYSVVASLNGCTSAAGSTNVIVKQTPTIPTTGSNSPVCLGDALNLTANSVTPGVSYNWSGPNGFTSNLQNPTISAATSADTGDYSVTATLNGCTSAIATTHAAIKAIASIGGWVSPNDTICEGTTVTFVAVPTNGGPNPTFQWFKTGTAIAGATSTLFVTANINTGDSFYCRMMVPGVCPVTLTLYSNGFKMHKLPSTLTPTVGISSTPAKPLPGKHVDFFATVVNGGYQPEYQWQRNGQDVYGAIYANWSADNLAPYDKISCKVTSSDPCATPKAVNSNAIIINFPAGVNNINGNTLHIYPNPVRNELMIEGISKGTIVVLFDIVGRELYRTVAGEESSRVNTSSLAKGNYLLQLSNADGRKVVKIVKE